MRYKVSIVCVLALWALAGCGSRNEETRSREIVSHIETLLREGDLVFRCGAGLTSRAVLMADDNGIYSHVGIVVGEGGEWKVVHIVPGEPDEAGVRDVIKSEAPELFFAPDRAKRGAVVRVGDSSVGIRVARRAKQFAAMPLAFDHEYDLDDTTRMYCTELVHNIFLREGLDLTDGRRSKINLPAFRGDYILPGDLLGSPHVSTVFEF